MGWLSNSGKAVGKAAAASLAWPVKRIASGAQSQYYKKKGKIVKGMCPECGNPISKDGWIHKKCSKSDNFYQKEMKTPHHSDGSSRAGVHFTNCNCNRNWTHHECKGKMGESI